jgi:hypothetical protein
MHHNNDHATPPTRLACERTGPWPMSRWRLSGAGWRAGPGGRGAAAAGGGGHVRPGQLEGRVAPRGHQERGVAPAGQQEVWVFA